MNIVIVGNQHRDSEDDRADVQELLDMLEAKYQNFTVLTVMSHVGIGRIVKSLCAEAKGIRKFRFPFCEADIRVYATSLSQQDMAQLYTLRNAMLFEGGDQFYSFPHPQRRAVIDELIEKRVIPNGRPYKTFLPGDDIEIIEL